MLFDPDNAIIKLCSQGMELEGQGMPDEAGKLFVQAWNQSTSDFEKFTSAHYVARHQKTVTDKLHWDEEALKYALLVNGSMIRAALPSLYLNIAKCHEELKDLTKARENYQLALSYTQFLSDDGYGTMIKRGILHGLERTSQAD